MNPLGRPLSPIEIRALRSSKTKRGAKFSISGNRKYLKAAPITLRRPKPEEKAT